MSRLIQDDTSMAESHHVAVLDSGMSLKSKSSGGPHLLLVRRRSSDTLVASGRTLNRVHGLSKYFGNFTDEDNSRTCTCTPGVYSCYWGMTWLWVSTTKPQVHTSSTLCRSWQHDRWALRHVVTLCDAPRLANAVLVGVPLSGPQRARLGCVVDGPSGARDGQSWRDWSVLQVLQVESCSKRNSK